MTVACASFPPARPADEPMHHLMPAPIVPQTMADTTSGDALRPGRGGRHEVQTIDANVSDEALRPSDRGRTHLPDVTRLAESSGFHGVAATEHPFPTMSGWTKAASPGSRRSAGTCLPRSTPVRPGS